MKPANEPRDHRVTVRYTVGGDINKTLRAEKHYLTATEWEQWLSEENRQLDAALNRFDDRLSRTGAKGLRP